MNECGGFRGIDLADACAEVTKGGTQRGNGDGKLVLGGYLNEPAEVETGF